MPKIKLSYSKYKPKHRDFSIIKLEYSNIEDSKSFIREFLYYEFKKIDFIFGRFIKHESLHNAINFDNFLGCEINLNEKEFSKLKDILKDRTMYEEALLNDTITILQAYIALNRDNPRLWSTD